MDRAAIGEEIVKTMVRAIVDEEDLVRTTSTVDERGVLILIRVHGNDLGRLIGKGGETIVAMRHYMQALGRKHNARYSLKVVENE